MTHPSVPLGREALEEIRARCEKATPGPWQEEKFPDDAFKDGFAPGVIVAATGRNQGIYANPEGGSFPAADRTFIAHARTDIPALLSHIATLEAEREGLRKKVLDAVPTNWLDSILTGPKAVLPSGYTYSPKDVERVLLAIRERIEIALHPSPKTTDTE